MIELVTQKEMELIFEVSDRLGIHRESLVVPLAPRTPGRVRRMPSGKIEIVVDGADPEAFFADLETRLRQL